jgi:pimeloyl-ACP methyl ester carboxylesterase
MESILETEAATILEFFAGLRGTLSVTFEEGTWAAWLYDLLKPHVAKLVVCNPRKKSSPLLDSQKEMAASIPGTKFVAIEGAAHAVFVDQSGTFDSARQVFLQSLR